MNVHKKLMQARVTLQSTVLKKSGQNKFAGYAYFELGDFIPEVQRIFNEIGISGVVSFGTELATLTITDIEDGSNIVISSPMSTAALKGCHEVQNLGAVQTYIRRYLWVSAMEIVEHDALDSVTGVIDPEEKERLELIRKGLEQIKKGNVISQQYESWMALKPLFENNDEEANAWGSIDSKTRAQIKQHGVELREAQMKQALNEMPTLSEVILGVSA